jgi:hypothetical protein
MVLLFVIFAIIAIRQFKKFNASKAILIGFVIMFLALSYSNIDGHVTRYNIARYESGTLGLMDPTALNKLSSAAHIHIYELFIRTENPQTQAEVMALFGQLRTPRGTTFREFNVQRHMMERARVAAFDMIVNRASPSQ